MPVDAKARLGRAQRVGVLLHHRAAVGDALLVDQKAHVVPDRDPAFRLHLRQPQNFLVRLRLVERARGERPADARLHHALAQPCDAGLKIRRRSGPRTEKAKEQGQGS